MQAFGPLAKLKHVTQNSYSATFSFRFGHRQHPKRGAYGGGTGIVTFVDQKQAGIAERDLFLAPATGFRCYFPDRFRRCLDVKPKRMDTCQHTD